MPDLGPDLCEGDHTIVDLADVLGHDGSSHQMERGEDHPMSDPRLSAALAFCRKGARRPYHITSANGEGFVRLRHLVAN